MKKGFTPLEMTARGLYLAVTHSKINRRFI